MTESSESGTGGFTPKELVQFHKYREFVIRHPWARRLFGRAHQAAFRLTGGRLGGTLHGTTIGR